MKRALISVCVALAPVLLLAGDPALIVSGGKLYHSAGDGTVATEIGPASLLENVHYMPGETPPPEPPKNDRVGYVEVYSRDVGDPEGAVAWAAVCKSVAASLGDKKLTAMQWERVSSIPLVSMNQKNVAWKQWLDNVNALDDFDRQFFEDVEEGLRRAYDIGELVDAAVAVATGEATADQTAMVDEALDFDVIVRLIELILDLLERFGII